MKKIQQIRIVAARCNVPLRFNTLCHSERSEESKCRGMVTPLLLHCFIFLLIPVYGSPLFAGDMDNLAEVEKEFIAQYKRYDKLKEEFNLHPVTKWKQEIARNEKAIAILEKQLRDMVRFENEEQIEELKRDNKELQKKIHRKKEEWEALKKKLDDAKKQLESLRKQLGATRAEEIVKGQVK